MFKSLLLKGRTLCLLLCCMVSSLVVTAQTKHTGKVIGADDKLPVVGASVRIKGTNTGTVTDVNGDFNLSLSAGQVIEISYIGYVTQSYTVRGTDFITISLQPSSSTLNEVVVTGYQTQLKKDVSGAVATVDVGDAKKIPATSSEQLLQGQAAGVTVVNSGAPGSPSNVYIRGFSNFNNSGPLYVVDGVQVNDMSLINPQDIESITVLKDAGTASIYGIAGGNGVVVVTTKKGKAGKTTISYDGFYGVQQPLSGNVWDIMNPEQQSIEAFRANDVATEGLYSGPGDLYTYGYHGGTSVPVFGDAGVTNDPSVLQYYHFDAANPGNDFLIQKFAQGAGTDWFHSVFSSAPTQQHTITGSGGTDKSTFLYSLNYVNQEGTLLSNYERRYQARINTSFTAGHIRWGETGDVTYRENIGGYPGAEQQEAGIISYTYREMPIIPVFDVAGNYGGGYDGPTGEPLGNGSNPYAEAVRQEQNSARFVIVQGNVFAEADIFKYFTLHTAFGGQLFNQYYNDIVPITYEDYESHANPNEVDEHEQYLTNWNWSNTLRYKETFGKHDITALAGYELRDNAGRFLDAYSNGLFSLDPNYAHIGAGSLPSAAPSSSIAQPIGVESYFGQAVYTYNDRYILTASVRRDGVSVFYPGHQWGTFPAISAAWRVTQEDFMKGVTWVNELKIRGSFGEAGYDNNVGASNPYNLFSSGPGSSYYGIGGGLSAVTQGFYNSTLGNQNTTWETDKQTNIGFDASLFGHFDLTLDWYKKYVSGLLFGAQLPDVLGGASPPAVNVGDVQNTGVDLSITYRNRISQDLSFSIGANITTYKNNIVKESTTQQYFDTAGSRDNDIVRDEVGHPIGEFFGYQVEGIYQNASQVSSTPSYAGAAPGSFIYKDVNGDGKIDGNDRTFIGNPNPNFTYGVNLNATFKRFDFTMVLYGSQGNKDFNYTEYWTDFYSTFQGGKSLRMFNDAAIVSNGVVTNPGATLSAASFANAVGSSTISSYYVQDGSFLKCRVLQIGYTLDPLLLKSIGVDKLHIYGQVTNLFTVTKYNGLDPEVVQSYDNNGTNNQGTGNASAPLGIDYGAYPTNQRQFILGVNLTF